MTAEKLVQLFPRRRSPFLSRRGQNHDQNASPRAPLPTRPVQSSSPYSTLPASTVQQPFIAVKMFMSDFFYVGRRSPEIGLHYLLTYYKYIHGYR